jgi:hypothetical protein
MGDNTQFFQNQRTYANEQFVGAAGASGTADLITAAGTVAGLAITTISGVQDSRKRALYEKNLDSLTADQQKALNTALLSANTESERMKLIVDTLTNLQSKRIDLLSKKIGEDEKKKRSNLIISASIIGVIAIGIIAVIAIKK